MFGFLILLTRRLPQSYLRGVRFVGVLEDCSEVGFGQKVPGAQARQRDKAMVPVEQIMQAYEDCPVLFPNFPEGHSTLDIAVWQYAPAGHRVHSVDPCEKAVVPV